MNVDSKFLDVNGCMNKEAKTSRESYRQADKTDRQTCTYMHIVQTTNPWIKS